MRKRLLVVALMNAASPFVAPRLALRRTLPSRRTRLHSETQIDNLERSWNISRDPERSELYQEIFSDGGDRDRRLLGARVGNAGARRRGASRRRPK